MVARAASPPSAAGSIPLKSTSHDAGSGWYRCFAATIALVTSASRAAGSARCVGSGASMTETWFPASFACSGVRTDSGTSVTSGWSGSASWSTASGAWRSRTTPSRRRSR